MFSAEILQRSISPRGMSFKVAEAPAAPVQEKIAGVSTYTHDRRFYKAVVAGKSLSGAIVQTEVEFSLPIPDKDGVFEIVGSRRYIAQEGFIDLHRFQLGKPVDFIFRSRTRVFLMALNEIFNGAFLEFFMRGQPPTSGDIQSAIDSWLRSSPLTQEVPESEIGLESLRDLVYLRVGSAGLDTTHRRFSTNMWNRIDPSSTPQGEKVNISYRMASGSTMVGGNLRPGNSMFCSVTERYGIAGKYSPRRLHLVRSGIEHALKLVNFERPLVGNAGIPGRHLVTAIMNYRAHTGEDAIVISESASKKLTAIKHYKEQVWSIGEIHMKVSEGDTVTPGQVLAEVIDPLDGSKTEVHVRKPKYPTRVESMRAVRTEISGIKAVRVDVMLRAEIPVESGDKLYTRAAVKGVARIVPDEKMPLTARGVRVEAIISPESVIGRRAMLVYWEMMANVYSLRTKQPVMFDHMNPKPTFEEFVELGYGDGVKLSLNEVELPEETFVGVTFFLRDSNLAREKMSGHGDGIVLNGMRVPVDSAKVSGQKRDLAKALAMLARGLSYNFTHSLIMNMHGQHAYRELIKVLNGSTESQKASE